MLAAELFLLGICNTKIGKEKKCKTSAKDNVPVPTKTWTIRLRTSQSLKPKMWKIHVFENRTLKVLRLKFRLNGSRFGNATISEFSVNFTTKYPCIWSRFENFWSNGIPYIFPCFKKLFLVERINLISIRAMVFLI